MTIPSVIHYCIQCVDRTTETVGTFAYDESKTGDGLGFVAISPVFSGLSGFYVWARAKGYQSQPSLSGLVMTRNRTK